LAVQVFIEWLEKSDANIGCFFLKIQILCKKDDEKSEGSFSLLEGYFF